MTSNSEQGTGVFTQMADTLNENAEVMAEAVWSLGEDLPRYFQELTPLARFLAAGVLYQAHHINRHIARALIWHPENVRYNSTPNTQSLGQIVDDFFGRVIGSDWPSRTATRH